MKTVLFVCVQNSGRSQMAEAFFNNLAGGKARAISAGTRPASRIDPAVSEVMIEIGMDMRGQSPKPLTPGMVESADRVITMGCGVEAVCPATAGTEDWSLEDPAGKPLGTVRRIRDDIQLRVRQLVAELA